MERTEIIPQTSNNLGQGHLYYHFSLMTSSTNAPNPGFEHQIALCVFYLKSSIHLSINSIFVFSTSASNPILLKSNSVSLTVKPEQLIHTSDGILIVLVNGVRPWRQVTGTTCKGYSVLSGRVIG